MPDPDTTHNSGIGTSVLVVLAVIAVIGVLVSPSPVLTEVCDSFLLGFDWEFVSNKRDHSGRKR